VTKRETDAIWREYQRLLNASAKRLEKKIASALSKLTPEQLASGNYQGYRKAVLADIKRESAAIKKAFKSKTGDTLASVQQTQEKWLEKTYGKSKPGLVESFATLSTEQGLVIANAETDIGVLIGKHIKVFNKRAATHLDELLHKASDAIKAGELEGLSIGEIVTDLRQNVIGLAPRKRMKGITADMNRLVRTTGDAVDFDIKNTFGRAEPSIIGVRIQRGPGPCPANLCGAGLGVSEGEIATFIYGKNDPPSLPLHPNSYAAIVGYVFDDDKQFIRDGAKTARKLKGSAVYTAYTKSRKKGYAASKAYAKKQRKKS